MPVRPGATDEIPSRDGGIDPGAGAAGAFRGSRMVSTGPSYPPLAARPVGLTLEHGMRSSFQRLRSRMKSRRRGVTLVIYGWYDSQPGTLAWVFPSLRAALSAVRAMRNAIRWLIVEGKSALEGEVDIEALRRAGRVLVERGVQG
jgi:hypothetical protein